MDLFIKSQGRNLVYDGLEYFIGGLIMTIIEWCNYNEGFMTAVFSLCSLFISMVAIWISVRTAHLPYKRAVKITAGTYVGVGQGMEDKDAVYVNALNVGNITIKINEVGLLHGKNKCINFNTNEQVKCTIKTMEDVEQIFPMAGLRSTFRGKQGRVYAFASDAEGHVYKKYLCKASDF